MGDKNIPEHIIRMEAILDKASKIFEELEEKIVEYWALQPDMRRLEEYYASPQWKKDFSMEEKGLFPKDVKRGVLSEDGIYDILERNMSLKFILENLKNGA